MNLTPRIPISPGQRIWQVMSRIGDLMVLNFLFLLCCVPVVTIGAASTALYTVCFRFDTDREQGLLKSYFGAFRENFRQSTALWLILLVCGAASGFNACIFYVQSGAWHYLFTLFAAMLALVLITAAYVFPLISQFANDGKSTLRNAVFLGIGYLPRSLVMVALNLAPFGCLVLNFYLFLRWGFVWAALYFAAAAYANTFLLKKVFAPYMPEEEEDDDPA